MKVTYLPYQPHCFAYGGFEIQMLNTFEAVKEMGVNVAKLDYWDRNSDFEVLHAWGLGTLNYETIKWAKKKDKKIVITALLPHYDTFPQKFKHWVSFFIHSSKFSNISLKKADRVVALNDIQAELLMKYFFVPEKKIEIIPNVVNHIFYEKGMKYANLGNYILSTGNICKRKNQLNLVKACKLLNESLVLVGNVLDGEEEYARKIENEIKNSTKITWIGGLRENSEELAEIYSNCKCFALVSFSEQQPISALEAIVLNKPVILADKSYSKQKYFNNCIRSQTDYESIACALKQIPVYKQNIYVNECKAENVGLAYKKLYEQL